MRIIKFFPFIFLAVFFVYLIDRVLLLDVSQNSLNLKSNPDLEKIKSPRPPVYLTSYADGDEIYFRNQNALALSALGKGVDHIINYRRSLLDPIFINQNKTIMDTAHGAGLWLWKPYIILETMKKAPEGAIIIYSDTGFIFKKEISDLLEKLKNQDIVIVECSKTIDGTVRSRVQKQTLNLMGVSDTSNLLDKNLMWAAFCMFKNSKKSRAFVQSWFDHASDPRKLMGHQDPLQPEDPSFQGHHYDQSILTLLAYQEQDKINFLSDTDLLKYTTWHHRSNREGINDRSAFDKLHFYLRPIYGFFSSTLRIGREVFYHQYSLKLFYRPFVLFYQDVLAGISRLKG